MKYAPHPTPKTIPTPKSPTLTHLLKVAEVPTILLWTNAVCAALSAAAALDAAIWAAFEVALVVPVIAYQAFENILMLLASSASWAALADHWAAFAPFWIAWFAKLAALIVFSAAIHPDIPPEI